MKTITIQIGNSDDKLMQHQWSDFIGAVQTVLSRYEGEQHFFGVSAGWERWQNACWVMVVYEEDLERIKKALAVVRRVYKQDSIAVTVGDTEFI